MIKAKYITIILLLITWIPNIVSAQYEQEIRMEDDSKSTASKDKEVEPKIRLWYLNGYGAFQDSTKMDTLQDYFHLYNPVYKDALTVSYVGNYGTPALNNNFFKRQAKTNYFFLQSRDAYLLTPSTTKYYNTTTPYTQLDYSQSENKSRKSEIRFNVFHSQNVNPYLNFTFRYDQAKSLGQYNYQESKNNFITLYSSYNKDKWNIYSGFISNSVKGEENGGLENESELLKVEDTEFINVNLSNARSLFSSSYFYTNAEYKIGTYDEINDSTKIFRPVVGILYSVQYERHKQEFIEEDNDSTFWKEIYYNEDYTKDSIRFNRLSNVFQLKQYENANKKVTFGKRAFLGFDFTQGSAPGKYIGIDQRNILKYSNVFVGGGIFRSTGKFWTWNFDGKVYLAGRNAGQTELNGIISKPFKFLGDSLAALTFDGSLENLVADPFQETFYSNHAHWTNSFKMEQRMTAGGKFVSHKKRIELGAKYSILNNYIFNDVNATPTQTDKQLVILSAFLDKDLKYRSFHFRTRLLWQKASNEDLIHLPDLSAHVSAYYKLVISKVMFTQIGAETRYNTAYYADAYAPNTGLFYLQNEKKYGNYPYIDVYVSLRLKRTRAFFKMMNIGSEFLDGEYITTSTYPMNRATFRLGVSWAFYD